MTNQVFTKNEAGEFAEAALPQYVCHKIVRAARIVSIAFLGDGQYRLALEGGLHVDVTKNWMANKVATVGGYYVQYEDGYASFSPAAAFEAGYELVVEEAQGSGSERNGASDWTQAGDGTDYPKDASDKIAELEKENAELRAQLESAKRVALSETPLIEAGLKAQEIAKENAELTAQIERVISERDILLGKVNPTDEQSKELVAASEKDLSDPASSDSEADERASE